MGAFDGLRSIRIQARESPALNLGEVVELIRNGPDATDRVAELPVQFARRRFSTRGFGDRTKG